MSIISTDPFSVLAKNRNKYMTLLDFLFSPQCPFHKSLFSFTDMNEGNVEKSNTVIYLIRFLVLANIYVCHVNWNEHSLLIEFPNKTIEIQNE